MKKDQFNFYKDNADEWRWRRTASNGEIVGASTEGYKNLHECEANAVRNGWGENQKDDVPEDAVFISKPNARVMREFLSSLLESEVVTDDVKNRVRPVYEELLTLEL